MASRFDFECDTINTSITLQASHPNYHPSVPNRNLTLAIIVALVKDGIEEDSKAGQNSLLGWRRVLGEFHVQHHGICKDFRQGRLGALHNDSEVGIVAARIGVFGRVNSVGGLAASLSAGISLLYCSKSTKKQIAC